jgi:hypothetical protein
MLAAPGLLDKALHPSRIHVAYRLQSSQLPPTLCVSCTTTVISLKKQQVRQASREAAIREIKERAKKAKADKAKQSKAAAAKSAPAPKAVGRGKR